METQGFFTNNNPHLAASESEAENQTTETPPSEEIIEKSSEKVAETTKETTNIDSFFNNISKPRQQVKEPPREEEKPNTNTDKEEKSNEEEETKEKAEPISKEALGLTAEFIVETEDLIIPELMASFDPDEDAEAEDYEAPEKHKKYLIASWQRYLDDVGVSMTPGQQLIAAHFGAYGMPLAVMAVQKFLKWKKESKEKEKENEVLNQNAQLLKQMQEMQRELAEARNQNTQAETNNRQNVTVEEQPSNNVNLKKCINEDCSNTFTPGNGFAKKKTSDLYDSACSRKCMNKVIGKKGGRSTKK